MWVLPEYNKRIVIQVFILFFFYYLLQKCKDSFEKKCYIIFRILVRVVE